LHLEQQAVQLLRATNTHTARGLQGLPAVMGREGGGQGRPTDGGWLQMPIQLTRQQ